MLSVNRLAELKHKTIITLDGWQDNLLSRKISAKNINRRYPSRIAAAKFSQKGAGKSKENHEKTTNVDLCKILRIAE